MSWDKNPYYEPKEFGLTRVAEMELCEPCYSFDTLAAWLHETGFYIGTDSGCSCPIPFENFNGLSDLTGPLTAEQVIEEATSLAKASYESDYALAELPGFVAAVRKAAGDA